MKKIVKISKFLILLSLGVFLISCHPASRIQVQEGNEVRNVIFLIGDGMGLATVYAAMTVSDRPLNFERCTHTGMQKTRSAGKYITDSAASGTAMASGKKTKNGYVGTDPRGGDLKSILEIAEDYGLATGMVATSAITHATPASFIAHDSNRDHYESIALDFLETDIDVFIGGGLHYFAERSDNINLIDALKQKGYQVETSLETILAATSDKLAGFTAKDDNPYRNEGRGNMLPAASRKAIEILMKNPKGFFLMIEGSQIDWAAHANNQETLIDEMLDFDEAIGIALDFAEKDGHTLVLVTADHETGGVSIIDEDASKRMVKLNFSTDGHTGIIVPVFAYGPCSASFSGIYENTEIFNKLINCYRFTP